MKATICGQRSDRRDECAVTNPFLQHDAFLPSTITLTTAFNSDLDRTLLKWLLLQWLTLCDRNLKKIIITEYFEALKVCFTLVTLVDIEENVRNVFFLSCDGSVAPVKKFSNCTWKIKFMSTLYQSYMFLWPSRMGTTVIKAEYCNIQLRYLWKDFLKIHHKREELCFRWCRKTWFAVTSHN